ncbi:MAG: RNA-binding protein [Gemmatimonadetes bacterium]|nr:RNA-binding protein [Gemmatimonadota bacterium]
MASAARNSREEPGAVRLDKWLWAARFYKTRSLAAQAIEGGKVELNGARAKRSKLLQVGDQVRVRHGAFEHHLLVRILSEHRGPALEAATLYEETPASRKARELLANQLRMAKVPRFEGKGRPTKKDRRELERLRDSVG